MAITATPLTSGFSNTDATSYATASITPAANRLILVAVVNRSPVGTVGTVTLSGNGLTWVEVSTRTLNNGTTARLTVFRAMGAAPSTGAITITATTTVTGISWAVMSFAGVNTSGANGAGAVGVTGSGAGIMPALSVSMGGAASVGNAWAGFWGVFELSGGTSITPAGTWVELSEATSTATGTRCQSQWDVTGDETTNAVTATGTNITWAGIHVEVVAAVDGSSAYLPLIGVG